MIKDNQLKNDFGIRLREERKRLGYSQKKFAELAGIRRITQYTYENEESAPNLRYLSAIAEIDVDISYILFGQRRQTKNLHLNPRVLSDIYTMIDDVCTDENGDPLPQNTRLKIFSLLCATHSGREEAHLDADILNQMLISSGETT